MFAEFEKYLQQNTPLTAEEIDLFEKTAITRTIRRKEFLLRDGEIARHKVFVAKGMLRSYRTTPDGSEHIMQFSPEDSWCTDPESYNNGTPSRYNIDALETTEVLMWTRNDFNYLFERLPELRKHTEQLIQRNLFHTRERVFSAISASAEQRYDEFLVQYPGIINRVPLHMVASFLGVTRETLSRIRHAQVKQ
ncbi:Crp/Fnr family transcriptional regulator [Mucilaginibacter ginkgonis]|uniref:Crp/Fnr family transcriptional regulator n=1 Tax=Mucilaginibacter ginkgonis TaxID=2682091 RepID=A0A6I4IML2_9SPHI|nr:Crp/Fnr family transcriptional regulator [Mucilaginibacter ginkgonis]QQL50445.1 Crp/Fnr family transcriptional regulator [Mucilaginibacter ginkgonis]